MYLSAAMKYILGSGRLLLFAITISIGILIAMFSYALPGDHLRHSMAVRRRWIHLFCWTLGFSIVRKGKIPQKDPVLYVSNHRSLMDPVATLYYIFAFPLAKAEVGKYPLIGFGAKITGLLLVKRNNLKSRALARDAIRDTLNKGYSVLIYPEGTTNIEHTVMPFKVGSFEVAMEENVPIIPIAIEYADNEDHWKERSLLAQYFYQFGKWRSRCALTFGSPIQATSAADAKDQVESWINQTIQEKRKLFDQGLL